MKRLEGLSALVVGGGSGIGRAVALAYLHHGAHVTVLERSAANAESLLAQCAGGSLEVVEGDGTSPEVLDAALGTARASGGGLDHLTCCVGAFDHYASLRTLDVTRLVTAADEIWQTNVLSALVAVKVAWPALHDASGSVTLTLSESAFHPVGGGVLYGSSKWALRGVVQHLAADLAPTVRVNGVAPGGTAGTAFSGLTALGEADRSVARPGRDESIAAGTLLQTTPTPDDHAAAFVHLADPVGARILTGQIINSDAGHSRKHQPSSSSAVAPTAVDPTSKSNPRLASPTHRLSNGWST